MTDLIESRTSTPICHLLLRWLWLPSWRRMPSSGDWQRSFVIHESQSLFLSPLIGMLVEKGGYYIRLRYVISAQLI